MDEENIDGLDNTLLDKQDGDLEITSSADRSANTSSKPEAPSDKVEYKENSSQAADKEQDREMSSSDSKFFAVRTTGGQEHVVVNMTKRSFIDWVLYHCVQIFRDLFCLIFVSVKVRLDALDVG